jgi:hypothetical protein
MQTGLTRWGGPIAGVVFAVLMVAGVLLMNSSTPADDDPDDEFIQFYDDSGNRMEQIVGAYILAGAGLAFLWFLNHLRRQLTLAGGADWLGGLMAGSGVVFVAMLYAAATTWVVISGSLEFGSTELDQIDPSLMRIIPQLGFGLLLIFGGIAAATCIAAASWAILRTAALPAWLGWLGLLAAIALLFAVIFLPLIALPIWVLAASVALWMQRGEATPPTTSVPG